ncbi:MAG: anaerobic ribonucleoside-triphosphate reductase activating protein [Lachnospiraceae bacterium]|nr:anaerobic ribonucleoside-triphosphate reductase activating protein [Lachnospiraceae bacterium]MCR5477668.1 anaerobic ribonucleoside-triphosphate reductase activating protein [Lachnospiraceae bacterium]
MNYASIKKYDIADGPGVRVSLFVSGCTHHCKGCFNPETWDFCYGSPYTEETQKEILEAMAPEYIRGFTCLGGEPMEPANRGTVLGLLREIRERFPEKSLWIYTGYLFDKDLQEWAKTDGDVAQILELVDVMVDGEFVLEKKNIRLPFRGSENQRVIDVPASLESGCVVLYELPDKQA